jgi:hypothetical protein
VIDPDELTACTGCGAVTTVYAAGTHRAWHELNGHRFNSAPAPGDDAPTTRLPPIGETVRRRPPVPPAVRELKGPELLRALADELDRDGLSIADLAGGFEARDAGDYNGCPGPLHGGAGRDRPADAAAVRRPARRRGSRGPLPARPVVDARHRARNCRPHPSGRRPVTALAIVAAVAAGLAIVLAVWGSLTDSGALFALFGLALGVAVTAGLLWIML